MSALSEKARSFSTLDEEEDALLNEAISCSRNLEIKTDDEEEKKDVEEVAKTLEHSRRSSKLWCDMNSDSSSNMSNVSDMSNGKIDLSSSGENVNASLHNGKECDRRTTRLQKIKNESVTSKKIQDESMEDGELEASITESNGRSNKRVRESESNDECPKVPKNRRNSTSSSSTLSSDRSKKPMEYEDDPAVLSRRQKDIDYGKNTVGYDRYLKEVPKFIRSKEQPRTPPMHLKCSRRAWDGMVKQWRKQLHFWDPKDESENKEKTEL